MNQAMQFESCKHVHAIKHELSIKHEHASKKWIKQCILNHASMLMHSNMNDLHCVALDSTVKKQRSFLLKALEVAIVIAASLCIDNGVGACCGVLNSSSSPLRYMICFVASIHAMYSASVVDSEVWSNLLASHDIALPPSVKIHP